MSDISKMTKHEMGKLFDQSIIGAYPDEHVRKLAENAVKYNMRTVHPCNVHYVEIVKEVIAGTDVCLGSGAIGFPLGSDSPTVKARSAEEMVAQGARSLDLTMNYGALMTGRYSVVEEELRLFREITKGAEAKCIIEVCMLTDDQIRTACKLVVQAGLDFVKSSTGQIQGPTMEQVCIILDSIKGTNTKCKVAGVKFPRPQNAMAFLLAGVERIGSQQCAEILDGVDLLRERGIIPPYQG